MRLKVVGVVEGVGVGGSVRGCDKGCVRCYKDIATPASIHPESAVVVEMVLNGVIKGVSDDRLKEGGGRGCYRDVITPASIHPESAVAPGPVPARTLG